MKVLSHSSPSLAFIKYWGKADGGTNLPAVPSLALTLDGLTTRTEVQFSDKDSLELDGKTSSDGKVMEFLTRVREITNTQYSFAIKSSNSFPTSAGLASSSSGFAALAAAVLGLIHKERDIPAPSLEELSRLARVGSGSASRAVFGGWTQWLQGSTVAEPLFGPEHWPEFRVLLMIVDSGEKSLGSRQAMQRSRETSPYFPGWVECSGKLFLQAKTAVEKRDLETLGQAARQSYLRMFSTMFTANPPVIFWKPLSLELIHLAEELRHKGLSVWETMDAGPQVKFLCLESELAQIEEEIQKRIPGIRYLTAKGGSGVRTEFF